MLCFVTLQTLLRGSNQLVPGDQSHKPHVQRIFSAGGSLPMMKYIWVYVHRFIMNKRWNTLLHRDTFAGQLSWSKKWISFAFAPRALQIMRILCRRYEYKTWIMVWTELNPWKWICAELGLLCVRRPDYEVAPDRIQSLPLFFSAPYPSVSVTEITEAESFASQLVLFTCKCSHQT